MSKLRGLVLDVLKPHSPSILELSKAIGDLEGISGVETTLIEMDKNVESVKIRIEGHDINYEDIERVVNENGGTIHSVDMVLVGKIEKETSKKY